MRRGFTLIELLVVMTIIAILLGMSLAAIPIVRRRAMINSTQATVKAVATAIASYKLELIPIVDPVTGEEHGYRAWNWNQPAGDSILDGWPEVDEPGITATTHPHHRLHAAGYRGFVDSVPNEIGAGLRRDGHVLDAWKRPLRIWWSSQHYGSAGFGIWSDGPDGVSATADDLTSWGRK